MSVAAQPSAQPTVEELLKVCQHAQAALRAVQQDVRLGYNPFRLVCETLDEISSIMSSVEALTVAT